MSLTRRGFLSGILAAGMAPAIVKAELLMPMRQLIVVRQPEPFNYLFAGRSGKTYPASTAFILLITKTFAEHQEEIAAQITKNNALFKQFGATRK